MPRGFPLLLGLITMQTPLPQRLLPAGNEVSHLSAHFPFLLDETRTLGLCGMVWEHKKGTDYHKQPWQAKISVTVSTASWWQGLPAGGVRVERGQRKG